MGTQNRGMGWLPDVPSIKDFTEQTPKVADLLDKTAMAPRVAALRARPLSMGGGTTLGAAAAPALAPAVDWRPFCPPIEDQLSIGSCTANTAVALVEYFEKRAHGHYVDASRLFVYKTTRNLLGWVGDTGAYMRTTMGALALFGAAPERYMPYDISKFDEEPSAFCYAFGSNYQALVYFRLDPPGSTGAEVLERVKAYLAAGFPSMFGFPVYDEFMNVPPSGLVAFPSTGSKLYGGHAQVAVGYDDNLMIGADKGALLVRNSWGTGWGLGGYAWMSYKYVTAGLAEDWWTMLKQEWVDTGRF